MALSESDRNNISNYKITIERYKLDLERLKQKKKDTLEDFANKIKNTKDASLKSSYKISKIRAIDSIVNSIESKKKDIEGIKNRIATIKK